MSKRDDFSLSTKRKLAERVSYFCSNPKCRRITVGPHSIVTKSLCSGRAAHIKAASPKGPRYDASQTSKERKSINNGIWLCANCADIIDTDYQNYTVKMLREWRNDLEKEVLSQLESGGKAFIKEVSKTDWDKAEKDLDRAFDAIAGHAFATRITWHGVPPEAMEEALRCLATAQTFAPNHPKIPIILAIYLVAKGYAEEALDLLEEETCIDDLISSQIKIRCLHDLGRFDESVSILEKLKENPESPPTIFYNYGLSLIRTGKFELAKKPFKQAIKLDPKYAFAHSNLGYLAYLKGNFEKAKRCCQIAHEIDPSNELFCERLLLVLLDNQEISKALNLAKKFAKEFPSSSEIWSYYGRALGQLGQLDEAIDKLLYALELDSLNISALNSLSKCYFFNNEINKFIEAKSKAIDLANSENIEGKTE